MRIYWVYFLAFLVSLLCLIQNNLVIHGDFNAAFWGDIPAQQQVKLYTPDLWVVDDAYISMRYAENFAQGKGLVFNEGERVEGYTTVSWVLLLGLFHKLGISLEFLAPFLCFVFSLLTLWSFLLVPKIFPSAHPASGAVGMVLLGSSGIFTIWAVGSMEVPMAQSFMLLGTFAHFKARESQDYSRWNLASAMLCVLVALTRPEGVLFFLICFVDRMYLSFKQGNATYFMFGLYFSLIFAPYLLWRYSYYGYILPNTFYAKVGSDLLLQSRDGMLYFSRFCSNALLIIGPLVTVYAVGATRPTYLRALWAPVAASIAIILFFISAGGDHMPASRLLAPTLPVLCLVAGLVYGSLAEKPRHLLLVALLATIWAQGNFWVAKDLYNRGESGNVGRDGKVVGIWMRENFPPGTLIATNTAGSIPYHSKLPTIDMLGLNDEHIAHRVIPNMGAGMVGHEKGDGRYVLSRKPDYIQFGSARGSAKPKFLSEREIAASSDFSKLYKLKKFKLPNGRTLQLYKRIKE